MTGRARALLAVCLMFAAGTMPAAAQGTISVTASRVPFYPDDSSDVHAGKLIFRGGLQLSSQERTFGGWSDLKVSTDGKEMLAISDKAHWLRMALTYDGRGDLSGVGRAEMAPIRDIRGNLMRGHRGDAEGLALAQPGMLDGDVFVSFEGQQRIWRFDLSGGRMVDAIPQPFAVGPWAKGLGFNKGMEAIVSLGPRRVLAFAEEKGDRRGDILAAIESPSADGKKPSTQMLGVVRHAPYRITGADRDADGTLYLLERRFTMLGGLGMEIRRIPGDAIRAGARLDGEVLLDTGLDKAAIDNMEGLAVRRDERGRTLLYILSDNNFVPVFQRSLLLMFEVPDAD
jgi:hypothetical protein